MFIKNINSVEYNALNSDLATFQFKDEDNDWKSLVKLNSSGYRSDEFITKHDGKHVLFAGCSITFGDGLELEEMWSKIVYNEMSKREKLSGYFNIAIPGASIQAIIVNIFKYVKKYGKPNVIFFNMPAIYRGYIYDIDRGFYRFCIYDRNSKNSDQKTEFLNELKLTVYQYYFMLSEFCKSNGIQLLSFSWDIDPRTNLSINSLIPSFEFPNFYFINRKTLDEYMYEYSKNSDDIYALVARDGHHAGTAENKFYADFIYNRYLGI